MPDTDTEADGLIEGLGLDVELIVPDAELETVCVPDDEGEDVPDTDAEADAEEVGVCPAVCSNNTCINISESVLMMISFVEGCYSIFVFLFTRTGELDSYCEYTGITLELFLLAYL